MRYERWHDPTAVMGRRIVAFAIDVLLINIIVAVFFRPDVTTLDGITSCSNSLAQEYDFCRASGGGSVLVVDYPFFTATMLTLGLWFLNAALLQGVTGATVGKTALGLRCVRANGEICGVGPAFIRTLALVIDCLFCYLVGLVTAFVSKGHRRVGDLAAGTYVVSASSLEVFGIAPRASAPPPGPPVPPEWNPPGPEAPPRGPGAPPPWSPN